MNKIAANPGDPIKKWINQISADKSFVDIGGIGEYSTNERVSEAVGAGAATVAMADIEPFSSKYWTAFREKMQRLGVSGFSEYEKIDIRDKAQLASLPGFDVVHCTGIVYHLPDPVMGVYNVCQLAGQWLIINTVVVPEQIKNKNGTITTEGSRALFLPALSESERAVLKLYYETKFGWSIDNNAPRLNDPNPMMPYITETGPSPWPYWWLFSHASFRRLIEMMGFKIHDQWVWEDHTLALLCERVSSVSK